jgi:hypothetical protein
VKTASVLSRSQQREDATHFSLHGTSKVSNNTLTDYVVSMLMSHKNTLSKCQLIMTYGPMLICSDCRKSTLKLGVIAKVLSKTLRNWVHELPSYVCRISHYSKCKHQWIESLHKISQIRQPLSDVPDGLQ